MYKKFLTVIFAAFLALFSFAMNAKAQINSEYDINYKLNLHFDFGFFYLFNFYFFKATTTFL